MSGPADRPAQRLDAAIVARGLASSRNRAAREIQAGRVKVDGAVITKPSQSVSPDAQIVLNDPDPWVARSAHKLLGAVEALGLDDAARGQVCLDAGASTGGFTQVLLSGGAAHVWAVDVGHGQLSESLASNPRVTNLEGTNLRDITVETLRGASPAVIVADVSFISLTLLIGPLLRVCAPDALLLLMVKPQFETTRSSLDKHGVVTAPRDRAMAVETVAAEVTRAGAHVFAGCASSLPGPSGNREYFIAARAPGPQTSQLAAPAHTTPATTTPGPAAALQAQAVPQGGQTSAIADLIAEIRAGSV